MKREVGFTLVELMVVVAIIAILAAISLPAYQSYLARSQFSESLSLSSGISRAVLDQFWQTGDCAASGSGGIPTAGDVRGAYVDSVTAGGTADPTGGCEILATFRTTGVSRPLQGKQVKLRLDATTATKSRWLCTSNVDARYLPNTCQYAP